MLRIIKRNSVKILFYIGIIFVILKYLTFRYDESYTLALIKNNFINVIKLDSYDVHPPLYYLLLKFYLDITTFWTSSIFIKIIFSRIFSLLAFIVSFYVLIDLINNLHVHIEKSIWPLLLLISFPSVFFFSTLIRMYALAGMFLILEFYYIYKFENSNNNIYLLWSTIFAILASYTHYFTAVSAGLILLISMIESLIFKDRKKCIKQCSSGLVLFASYLPWILYSLTKSAHSKGPINFNINFIFKQYILNFTGITDSALNSCNNILKLLLVVMLFSSILYLLCWSFKNLNKQFNLCLMNIMVNLLLTGMIMGLASILGYENSPRFIYPIFLLNIFFIIVIFIIFIKRYNINKLYKILIFILFLLPCIFNDISTMYYSNIEFKQSNYIYNKVISWKEKGNIFIKYKSWATDPNHTQPFINHKSVFYMTDNATYLYYGNKKLYTNKINLPISNSEKIGRKVFPNIIIKKN